MKKVIRLTESDLHRIVRESVNIILEDLGGTSSFSVNSPAGSQSDPTGQQKNHIDLSAFGPDKDTQDRHPGFSVDGKVKGKTSVISRPVYNPKMSESELKRLVRESVIMALTESADFYEMEERVYEVSRPLRDSTAFSKAMEYIKGTNPDLYAQLIEIEYNEAVQ